MSRDKEKPASPKRDVMQFVQEQEAYLQKHFRAMPKNRHKRNTRICPGPQPPTSGIDHLDYLVRLMEQLASLKDENSRLKQRCDFLESSRSLLQARDDVSRAGHSALGFMTPPSSYRYSRTPSKHHEKLSSSYGYQNQHFISNGIRVHTLSEPEDNRHVYFSDSSSNDELDFNTKAELSSEKGHWTEEDIAKESRSTGKRRRSKVAAKTKPSRWKQVKNAIAGHKINTDIKIEPKPHRHKWLPSRGQSPDMSPDTTKGSQLHQSKSRSEAPPGGFSENMFAPKIPRIPPLPHKVDSDPDLTTEIWMGPPDWWEAFEAKKESCGNSSETSSAIEITTLYLGSAQDSPPKTPTKPIVRTSASSKPHERVSSMDDTMLECSHSRKSDLNKSKDDLATRSSSSIKGGSRPVHTSSSCRSDDLDVGRIWESLQEDSRLDKKANRSAWDRVKDIIHVRKDSFRRRFQREKPDLEDELYLEDLSPPPAPKESLHRRPSRKHPTAGNSKSPSEVSPKAGTDVSKKITNNGQEKMDMTTLLANNLNEAFSKKMNEWEQIKSKKRQKRTIHASNEDSDLGSLDLSAMPQLPVRTVDLRDFRGKALDNASDELVTEESNTSMEVLGVPSVSVDDRQPDLRRSGHLDRGQDGSGRITRMTAENGTVSKEFGSYNGGSEKGPNSTAARKQVNNINHIPGSQSQLAPLTTPDQPPWDSSSSSGAASRGARERTTAGDDVTLVKSNIATLERANTQLLENLHNKELEYSAVQEEVQKVSQKLTTVRQEHAAEMAKFHADLSMGKFLGPVKLEVSELESSVELLEQKIKMMESFGETLASSMESAAIGKWQSIEAEETVHKELVDLVDQMRQMLIQASKSDDQSQKILALTNFETLYAQAMKLQVQMNNLRLSHLERNREILLIKRQLLLQEVNNLLLQADISRRETELYQFQEAKRWTSLRRWKTFTAPARSRPQVQVGNTNNKASEPVRLNIPHVPEIAATMDTTSWMTSRELPSTQDEPAQTATSQETHTTGSHSQLPETAPEPAALLAEIDPPLPRHLKHHSPLLVTYLTQQQLQASRPELTPDTNTISELGLPSLVTRIESLHQNSMTSAALNAESLESEQHEAAVKHDSGSSIETTRGLVTRISESETKASEPLPQVAGTLSVVTGTSFTSFDTSPADTNTSPAGTGILSTGAATSSTGTDSLSNAGSASAAGTSTSTIATNNSALVAAARLHKEIAELKRVHSQFATGVSEKGLVSEDQSELTCHTASLTPETKHIRNKVSSKDASVHPIGSDSVVINEPRSYDMSFKSSNSTLPIMDVKTNILNPSGDKVCSVNVEAQNDQIASPETAIIKQTCHSEMSVSEPAEQKGLESLPIETEDPDLNQQIPNYPRRQPLPRHKLITQCPPITPRSKSAGAKGCEDPDLITEQPLREVLDKFQSRSTVYEVRTCTTVRPLPLSPSLHLPRVGLLSGTRRIQPAPELLAGSQKYRKGCTITNTRMMERYLSKSDNKPCRLNVTDEGEKKIESSHEKQDSFSDGEIQKANEVSASASSDLVACCHSLVTPNINRLQGQHVSSTHLKSTPCNTGLEIEIPVIDQNELLKSEPSFFDQTVSLSEKISEPKARAVEPWLVVSVSNQDGRTSPKTRADFSSFSTPTSPAQERSRGSSKSPKLKSGRSLKDALDFCGLLSSPPTTRKAGHKPPKETISSEACQHSGTSGSEHNPVSCNVLVSQQKDHPPTVAKMTSETNTYGDKTLHAASSRKDPEQTEGGTPWASNLAPQSTTSADNVASIPSLDSAENKKSKQFIPTKWLERPKKLLKYSK